MSEVIAAAAACGQEVDAALADEMVDATIAMPAFVPSFKQDFDAGAPLELDAIFGNPLRAARRGGYAAPRLDELHRRLRVMDRARSIHPSAHGTIMTTPTSEPTTPAGTIRDFAVAAKAASRKLARLSTEIRIERCARWQSRCARGQAEILAANAADIAEARDNGAPEVMISRLTLSVPLGTGIDAMCATLEGVAALPDPIGAVDSSSRMPKGIEVAKVRVPLGVIAMIYESRPSVLVDSVALGIKSGNAMLLRGGRTLRSISASSASCSTSPRAKGFRRARFACSRVPIAKTCNSCSRCPS